MERKTNVGEYVTPEIDVIEIKSQGVLCESEGIEIPGGTGYGYEPW